MNYEPKKCHFCHSSDIRKHGIRNNIQRYECNACNKTFTLKKKLNPPLSRDLNIIADTTFFGREFSILLLMDSLSKKVVYHRVIKTEKVAIVMRALRKKHQSIAGKELKTIALTL
ncbi:hypothetical protein Q7404_04800, partial [Glaesserella parasuis]|nr:hypothetical protein [Glaesserella parasuis]